ncbi:MAG: hypothetical protein WDN45_03655 [Caulobacteraceae bacterium]
MLIEGAGGAMTPLNDTETMLDLALALRLRRSSWRAVTSGRSATP